MSSPNHTARNIPYWCNRTVLWEADSFYSSYSGIISLLVYYIEKARTKKPVIYVLDDFNELILSKIIW